MNTQTLKKSNTFEERLVEGIQPIRYFALATSIYHMFNTGLYSFFSEKKQASLDTISEHLKLDRERLNGFLKYLNNEKIIEKENNEYRLTYYGETLKEFEGWYTMFIGGYGQTFLEIGHTIYADQTWATRNSEKVGVGSCKISYYDALPLTKTLMKKIPKKCTKLLDLGCGNALYLAEFCQYFPDLIAWGVEPSVQGSMEAKKLIAAAKLEHRVKIINASAVEFLNSDFNEKPDLIVFGFVLHEILGQEKEEGVMNFLKQIIKKYPDIYIIAIEVDDQIDNNKIMEHHLAQAYYNPYYLLHYFTNQKLETDEFWKKLFKQCGLAVMACETTNAQVDSTRLEIGYLLKKE